MKKHAIDELLCLFEILVTLEPDDRQDLIRRVHEARDGLASAGRARQADAAAAALGVLCEARDEAGRRLEALRAEVLQAPGAQVRRELDEFIADTLGHPEA